MLSIFTAELWVLICARQQHDPQKQVEALDKALFSEYHTSKCVNRPQKWPISVLYSCRPHENSPYWAAVMCGSYFLFTCWMVNTVHVQYIFRPCVFVLEERALPANSSISACHSQCVFWIIDKSLWLSCVVRHQEIKSVKINFTSSIFHHCL